MKVFEVYLTLILTFAAFEGSLVESTVEESSVTSSGQTRKSDTARAKFVTWKKSNKKSYKSKEQEKKAESNYMKAQADIEAHNSRKNETYKRKANEDADLTYSEKKVKKMGLKKPTKAVSSRISTKLPRRVKGTDDVVPNATDYRANCTAIKNQDACGACWAFSATSVLEYQIKTQRNVSVQLSDQELIDCNTDNMNCADGGWPTTAYEYIIKNGLSATEDYEFVGYVGDCAKSQTNRTTRITNNCELDMGADEVGMKWLIANYGPVVVAIYATGPFTEYKSGVYYEAKCPTLTANHAVAIVGYGTDEKLGDFWWIRNSWGTSWGYDGYGKFARNKNNLCGIANYAMFPCDTTV